MSVPVKPGQATSEHARAWRAEALGGALALAGTIDAFAASSWVGAAVCAIGVSLVGWSLHAYASSRTKVKAATASRIPAAPRV